MSAALRVEKRKWDGSVSSVDGAEPLPPTHGAVAWLVRAGAERRHPKKRTVEAVAVTTDGDRFQPARGGGTYPRPMDRLDLPHTGVEPLFGVRTGRPTGRYESTHPRRLFDDEPRRSAR